MMNSGSGFLVGGVMLLYYGLWFAAIAVLFALAFRLVRAVEAMGDRQAEMSEALRALAVAQAKAAQEDRPA